ncbi:hypothetical protein DPMN_072542 [Dreissena polymorpha]|uniref:Uncharacterized protein n=1 Tax=Dreissena polymorpha TaxID=45954 RepID=A0A9D3Z9G7_DREPO|nr:hypothetical protein DPMN_072542 [Dreissena polymorpha]
MAIIRYNTYPDIVNVSRLAGRQVQRRKEERKAGMQAGRKACKTGKETDTKEVLQEGMQLRQAQRNESDRKMVCRQDGMQARKACRQQYRQEKQSRKQGKQAGIIPGKKEDRKIGMLANKIARRQKGMQANKTGRRINRNFRQTNKQIILATGRQPSKAGMLGRQAGNHRQRQTDGQKGTHAFKAYWQEGTLAYSQRSVEHLERLTDRPLDRQEGRLIAKASIKA